MLHINTYSISDFAPRTADGVVRRQQLSLFDLVRLADNRPERPCVRSVGGDALVQMGNRPH